MAGEPHVIVDEYYWLDEEVRDVVRKLNADIIRATGQGAMHLLYQLFYRPVRPDELDKIRVDFVTFDRYYMERYTYWRNLTSGLSALSILELAAMLDRKKVEAEAERIAKGDRHEHCPPVQRRWHYLRPECQKH